MRSARVDQHIVPVSRDASRDDLLLAHAADYLDSLTGSAQVAEIVELSEESFGILCMTVRSRS